MPLRNETEIQKAHDVLSGLLLKEIPVILDPAGLHNFHLAADVLCWVLQHDHNEAFGNNLKKLYAFLSEQGFEIKSLT
jgi:hypothetical protein